MENHLEEIAYQLTILNQLIELLIKTIENK